MCSARCCLWTVNGFRHKWICYWFKFWWRCNFALNPVRFCWSCKGHFLCCNQHGCSNPTCVMPCVSLELCSNSLYQDSGAGVMVWLYIALLHVHVLHRPSTRRKGKSGPNGHRRWARTKESPPSSKRAALRIYIGTIGLAALACPICRPAHLEV